MFTDGLVERRGETIDDGLSRLLEDDRSDTAHVAASDVRCTARTDDRGTTSPTTTSPCWSSDAMTRTQTNRRCQRITGGARSTDRPDRRHLPAALAQHHERRRKPAMRRPRTVPAAGPSGDGVDAPTVADPRSAIEPRRPDRTIVVALDSTTFFDELDMSPVHSTSGSRFLSVAAAPATTGRGSSLRPVYPVRRSLNHPAVDHPAGRYDSQLSDARLVSVTPRR